MAVSPPFSKGHRRIFLCGFASIGGGGGTVQAVRPSECVSQTTPWRCAQEAHDALAACCDASGPLQASKAKMKSPWLWAENPCCPPQEESEHEAHEVSQQTGKPSDEANVETMRHVRVLTCRRIDARVGINAFSGSLGVPGVAGARYVSVEALKPQDSYVMPPSCMVLVCRTKRTRADETSTCVSGSSLGTTAPMNRRSKKCCH